MLADLALSREPKCDIIYHLADTLWTISLWRREVRPFILVGATIFIIGTFYIAPAMGVEAWQCQSVCQKSGDLKSLEIDLLRSCVTEDKCPRDYGQVPLAPETTPPSDKSDLQQ